jgi:hypothetical protein
MSFVDVAIGDGELSVEVLRRTQQILFQFLLVLQFQRISNSSIVKEVCVRSSPVGVAAAAGVIIWRLRVEALHTESHFHSFILSFSMCACAADCIGGVPIPVVKAVCDLELSFWHWLCR